MRHLPSGGPVTIGSEPSQTYNCGPGPYTAGVAQYMTAVRGADPNAKVCAVLTTPGFWPDGVTNAQTSPQPWNQTVLTALGSSLQCVIVHYYPGGSSAAGMLTDPAGIAGIVAALHSEITQYAGISNAASIPILVTETNSTIDTDTQPGALFTADEYLTWLENGAANVDYWNEHNGAHHQHGRRRYRLRRPGHSLQRVEQQRDHRATGGDAVRALLRDRDADQAGIAGRRTGDRHIQ